MRSRPISLASASQKADLLASLRATKEFCSTREAADVLGVAPGTVQKMVREHELEAWVTGGGHRRIRVDSIAKVLSQLTEARSAPTTHPLGAVELKLLITGFPASQADQLAAQVKEWDAPIRVMVAQTPVSATILVCQERPHVVLLYANSGSSTGLRFVQDWVQAGLANEADFLVVTDDSNASAASQEDWVTAHFKGAVPYGELRAFCQARLAQIIRERRKRQVTKAGPEHAPDVN